MILETKFDLNQRVWGIGCENYRYSGKDCAVCHRSGRVVIEGENLFCPKCLGRSVPPQWKIEENHALVVRVETIRTLDALVTESDWDNSNRYRLWHVGDGRVWPERDLFASKKEAEEECARRNATVMSTVGDSLTATTTAK